MLPTTNIIQINRFLRLKKYFVTHDVPGGQHV